LQIADVAICAPLHELAKSEILVAIKQRSLHKSVACEVLPIEAQRL